MLRKIRQFLAIVSIIIVTLLFLDFTGTVRTWFGWMAKIQFLPALLALNAGVILGLLILTLIFGRIYCSVICPLGIMQDLFGYAGKKAQKNRYSYSPAKKALRYTMLLIMAVAIVAGIGSIVALLAPYSAYGRIVTSLLRPLWVMGNNDILAKWAEVHDSYAFYSVDTIAVGGITLVVAVVTLVCLAVLAWRNGRTYCNTICPVGTLLGFFARFSILKPVIDTSRCVNCGLCARNCKAACINTKEHTIDYTRCVTCFDCLEKCHVNAISYTFRRPAAAHSDEKKTETGKDKPADTSRRSFIAVAGLVAGTALIEAKDKVTDGGLAVIEEKKVPKRATRIVPPGAVGIRHLQSHCTACQLCVANCPNQVLRPSSNGLMFMQPEASYERGYCRPECTRCSEVCPTGAILPVSREDKSSIQIGHAVWVRENCIVISEGQRCGNCARHCPAGAIMMVRQNGDKSLPMIPVVNEERCIGCGACENLCPAAPFSAIYVEGHETHRII